MTEDCASVGFSGEGRCIEPAMSGGDFCESHADRSARRWDEISSAERAAEMVELQERLGKAVRTLDEMAPRCWEAVERARVRGKSEGIRVALSYLDEALRTPRETGLS